MFHMGRCVIWRLFNSNDFVTSAEICILLSAVLVTEYCHPVQSHKSKVVENSVSV